MGEAKPFGVLVEPVWGADLGQQVAVLDVHHIEVGVASGAGVAVCFGVVITIAENGHPFCSAASTSAPRYADAPHSRLA